MRGAVVKYSVLIVSPASYPHSECFREVAETIADALARLGHQAEVTTRVRSGTRHIILGAHLLLNQPMPIPDDSIIYNLEQIENNAFFATSSYFELLRRYALWDYSPDNVKEFARHHVHVQAVLPIGYFPGLTRIEAAADQDIDVLFIGSINQRRKDILDGIEKAGLKVVSLFNKYGTERDVVIARSKLLLNVHFYPAKILEQVRVSYYLANRVAVLCEESSDAAVDAEWAQAMLILPYDRLIDEAVHLCRDDESRRILAARGFDFMKTKDIAPDLEVALAAFVQPVVPASLRRNDPCFCRSGKKYKHCHGTV